MHSPPVADVQELPRESVCLLRSEEYHDIGHIFRGPDAAERCIRGVGVSGVRADVDDPAPCGSPSPPGMLGHQQRMTSTTLLSSRGSIIFSPVFG